MNKAKYLNDIISEYESESIVQSLIPLNIENYCSESMIKKYTSLEKLNMQSHKNSLLGGDDYIMNSFILEDKLKDLVKDLFIVDLFKIKVYPLIKKEILSISSLKTYICLHYECIVVNLLEKFLFHVTACQSIEGYLIDIIEYSYHKFTSYLVDKRIKLKIVNKKIKSADETENDMENKEILMGFNISMACVSIIRYITDHLEQLPFPITHYLLNSKDIPLMLVELIDSRPWEVNNEEGELSFIYNENMFIEVGGDFKNKPDISKLLYSVNKYEAQVWISIYNLFLMHGKKYEITEYRKNILLRLKKYMNQKLYDSIPPLANLYRSLEEMNLMNSLPSSTSKNNFIVEPIPELFTYNHSSKNKTNFQEIGRNIVKNYFVDANLKQEMRCIGEVYSSENLDYFMDNPVCATCGKEASSRCSQCKSEWYCSKECQIYRWKNGHKEICLKIKDMLNDVEKNKK